MLVVGVGGPVSSSAISSTASRRFWDASSNDGVDWMNAFIWFSFAMTHFRFRRFDRIGW